MFPLAFFPVPKNHCGFCRRGRTAICYLASASFVCVFSYSLASPAAADLLSHCRAVLWVLNTYTGFWPLLWAHTAQYPADRPPPSPPLSACSQLSFNELVALYAITDVALVTSLRDGMNLGGWEGWIEGGVGCEQGRVVCDGLGRLPWGMARTWVGVRSCEWVGVLRCCGS